MLFKIFAIVLVSSVFVLVENAFVDNLKKCALKDEPCVIDLHRNVLRQIGSTGASELGIPPVDPMQLKDVTVSINGLVDVTLIDVKITGAKDCIFTKYPVDIEKERGSIELQCDLVIEGQYKAFSENPLLKSLLGGATAIRGEGNAKVELEKIVIDFDFPIYAQKRDDGEIYINCDFDKVKYEYNILGKAKFFADNIYLDEQEASKTVVAFLNDNWKIIMSTFGKGFVDKAIGYYFDFTRKFFDNIPAKHYLTDDLTAYAKP